MSTQLEYSPYDQEGLALVGDAELLKVEDDESFQKAAVLLRMVKAFRQRVAEITDKVIKAAHEAHKAALKQKADLEGHAKEAEEILKNSITAYEQRVEAQRKEAERQQQEIRERAEAAALAQQAETQLAIVKRLEEQTLALALEAERRGDTVAAERILEQPRVIVTPPPPTVFVPPLPMPVIPRAEGIAFGWHYSAEVEDFSQLVKAVAASQGVATIALLQPNQQALDALARTLKDELKLPGVKLVKKRKAAASA